MKAMHRDRQRLLCSARKGRFASSAGGATSPRSGGGSGGSDAGLGDTIRNVAHAMMAFWEGR